MTREEAIQWIQLDIDMAKFDPTTGEDAYLNDDAKNVIEAQEMAISALKAQTDLQQNCNQLATDTISRQAAIDAECEVCRIAPRKERGHNCTYYVHGCKEIECLRAMPSAQPEPCEDAVSRKLMYELGATCMARRDENGELVALGRLDMLPSVQPEVIRCKDCRYWHREIHNGIEYFNFSSCDLNHHGDGNNFYCADAEGRTDESD